MDQERENNLKITNITNWKVWIGKVLLAGIIAFIILNVLAQFYYTPPQKIATDKFATDFVVEKNYTGYISDEGIAKFRTDVNGYNNASVPAEVDVLIMGSSHSLGYTVNPGENLSYILQQKLKGSDLSTFNVYNIAMWGHTWYVNANNFENAVKEFQPKKYVVMEIHDQLEYTEEILPKVINHTLARENVNQSKLVSTLKKFPYFQLLMHQLKNVMNVQNTTDTTETATAEKDDTNADIYSSYKSNLETVVQNMQEQLKPYGSKLVFYYMPHLELAKDGSTQATTTEYVKAFKEVAEEYDVIFIDMSEDFTNYYEKTNQLPFGFINTEVGVGHLNRYGHELVGDAIYQAILQNEELGGK
ncbi:SGNH/GDSL hydrolase family protein [Anaerosporobacter sp.]